MISTWRDGTCVGTVRVTPTEAVELMNGLAQGLAALTRVPPTPGVPAPATSAATPASAPTTPDQSYPTVLTPAPVISTVPPVAEAGGTAAAGFTTTPALLAESSRSAACLHIVPDPN